MHGEGSAGVEDVVRRNIAVLRSRSNLTQQGLAEEMQLRGVGWTRETVAQVETTNRRIGLTEAIAVAACLDVPLARLTSTGAGSVAVGDGRWSTAYLNAAIAGTAGDVFPMESYATSPERYASPPETYAPPPESYTSSPERRGAVAPTHRDEPGGRWADDVAATWSPPASDTSPMDLERRRRSRDRHPIEPPHDVVEPPVERSDAPQRAAERIERRLRLRVTADDVDTTAQQLWSRSLDLERERRVADRHSLTGGSLPTIRGHVSRDLDRELAHEMERRSEYLASSGAEGEGFTANEAAWEATRLNIILANKGYSDSDVTRWWNFTRHRELGDQTIAEAWRDGRYSAVSGLIQSLPDKLPAD